MDLLEGYKFYKTVQGTKYDKNNIEVKENLQHFKQLFGEFTDKIFLKYGLKSVGKGMWQNSGNFTKYMWNRYKFEDKSNLVIYCNASTIKKQGIFLGIGLIDDKLTEFEKENINQIYNYLNKETKKIQCEDFTNQIDTDNYRFFKIINEESLNTIDYDCLIVQLIEIYNKILKQFYTKEESNNIQIEQPLNQILYGPPGTGKTYHTINKAIEIIENRRVSDDENREELKNKFNEYKQNGQIEFITFHQSYSYEEFVEGLKALTDDNGNISYSVEDGILKKLSERAEKNYLLSLHNEIKKDFYEILKEKLIDVLENDEKVIISLKRKKIFVYEITDKSIKFEKANGDKSHSLSIKTLKKMYEANDVEEFITGGLEPYYKGILNFFNKDNIIKDNDITLKNYILIIDEINRGNISKIFGELITLIEQSKRVGAEEEIQVRLPYGGDDFGVPQNLYILGTMNTADRSIALLDTALRRRFEFIEMMPEVDILDFEVENINIKFLLKTINARIEYLYDRDHTIGHAYFLSLKDNPTLENLNNIFKNKIIPLLQEYFYDDWQKINLVLNNNNFIKEKTISNDLFYEDIEEFEDKKVFYIDYEAFIEENYIKIYETTN